MDLKNKTVLITGGSSGIGKASALLFAKHGANIAISYRNNKDGADEVVEEISKIEANAVAFQANLVSDKAAKELVENTIKHFGNLDILINNAGNYLDGDEWDGDYDIWEESLRQNLLSVLSTSKYALMHMRERQSGVIVNIASRYSIDGQFDAITYAAAKSSIVNITQAYAKLMLPWGRCNAISPGTVRSGYWLTAPKEELDKNIAKNPQGKLINPEDIAEAVLFLASDKSGMITGQNLLIDGGSSLKTI